MPQYYSPRGVYKPRLQEVLFLTADEVCTAFLPVHTEVHGNSWVSLHLGSAQAVTVTAVRGPDLVGRTCAQGQNQGHVAGDPLGM